MIVLLLVVALLAALRLAVGRYADRRLADAAAAVRATGAPFDREDLQRPAPLPHDDAAPLLRRSAASINYTRDQRDAVWRRPFDDREVDPALLDAAVSANAAALADARAARSRSGADWTIDYRDPMVATPLRDLGSMRDLGRLLRSAAVVEARRGDSAGAIERVFDLLHVAGCVSAMPFRPSQDARAELESEAAVAVGLIVAALDVAADPRSGSPPPRDAGRQRVCDLIARLLDDADSTDAAVRGAQGDRVSYVESALHIGRGAPLLAPTLRIGAARLSPRFEPHIAAFAAPDLPAARAAIPATAPVPRGANGPGFDLSETVENLMIVTSSSLNRHFQASADRRVAAVALAVRLYVIDHDGALPPSLVELVPDYLPAVPRDPLRAGVGPIGYDPGPADPRVWSVGLDGRDDGGARVVRGPQNVNPSDNVFPLSALRRPPSPD